MSETAVRLKLNHMSFPTTDVPATSAFFEKYLGFTIAGVLPRFSILKRPGMDVVIESVGEDSPTPTALRMDPSASANAFPEATQDEAKWPKAFHIGVELPTVEDLRSLRDQLAADGFGTETNVFPTERGSRFFCRAPGGVLFEFGTRSDAHEQYRGTFDN